MNIIIFGASGRTGKELVKQGLAQGHNVRAFVRDPSKLALQHPNLDIFQSDVASELSVRSAMKGQEVVISALRASSPFKFDQVIVDGVGHIVNAMKQENIRRLIYLSVVAVKGSKNIPGFFLQHIAPVLLKHEIKGHEAKETIIRASGLEWTILHAPGLTNGKHKQVYRQGENISSKGFMATVSRADVADLMLSQISDHSYIRKAVRILY